MESQRWALYDTQADPDERIDISEQHSAKFDELVEFWELYRADNGVFMAEPKMLIHLCS